MIFRGAEVSGTIPACYWGYWIIIGLLLVVYLNFNYLAHAELSTCPFFLLSLLECQSLYHHGAIFVAFSLEINPFGNLHDVMIGEGTIGIEIVTAMALQPADQLAHVRREGVLGRGAGHACRPGMDLNIIKKIGMQSFYKQCAIPIS